MKGRTILFQPLGLHILGKAREISGKRCRAKRWGPERRRWCLALVAVCQVNHGRAAVPTQRRRRGCRSHRRLQAPGANSPTPPAHDALTYKDPSGV